MKKMIVIIIALLLTGCVENSFDGEIKEVEESAVIDINGFDFEELSYFDIVEQFGEADYYGTGTGERIYDLDELPYTFIMSYNNSLGFVIRDNKIHELRIEDGNVKYSGLYELGDSIDEIMLSMGGQYKTLYNETLTYEKDILYKNYQNDYGMILSYYHDSEKDIRFWFRYNKLSAIYYRYNQSSAQQVVKVTEAEAATQEKIELDFKQYDDVRDLDLDNKNYNSEDIKTYWFNENTNFGNHEDYAAEIMKMGMNPGLGIRSIHEKGIIGEGVKVGIIDQHMCLNHPEFIGKIVEYKDFGCNQPNYIGSMHGPAVTSLLVGETIGVAPKAEVYYAAVPSWLCDSKYYSDALLWIIEINKTLPEDDKIRVVSVSAAPSGEGSPFEKNNDSWDEAMKFAKEQDILVLDCTRTYGFIRPGYYDIEDPDNLSLFNTGWPNHDISNVIHKNYIFAPTSLRTQAEQYNEGEPSFQFTGKGGLSWAIPYVAGTLALGWEVDPTLTSDEIKEILFATAYKLENGNLVVNPIEFVEHIAMSK